MSTRDRLLLGTIAMAAVVAALWLLVVAPKRHEATDLGAKVTQAEQARSAAVAKAVSAEAAKATYSRDYATVARLGKAVPSSADVPSLVYQLESAARAAKVDFRSVAVQTATASAAPGTETTTNAAGGGLVPTPFTFTFEGNYFALRRLLGQVDRFSRVKGTTISIGGRLLTIDGVTLSAGREGLPQVKAEISAKAYVGPVPSLSASSAATAAAATPTTAPTAQVTP